MGKTNITAVSTRHPDINIGISASNRSSIAGGLSSLLADTYTLYCCAGRRRVYPVRDAIKA